VSTTPLIRRIATEAGHRIAVEGTFTASSG
jgi:hypothetical protein